MSSEDDVSLLPAYNDLSNSNDSSNVYGKQSNQYPCQNLQPPDGARIPGSPGGVYGQTSVAVANSEAVKGHVAAAMLHSRYARNWLIVSVVLGIFSLILIVVSKVLKYQSVDNYGR